MSKEDSFPLSQSNAQWIVILSIIYGLLDVASGCYYIIVSGDRSFPIQRIVSISIVSACAWGIHKRRRWAWAIAAAFSVWQIFYGLNNLILFLNAGGLNAPAPAKIIMGLLAIRIVIQLALFILLVILADRKKMFGG